MTDFIQKVPATVLLFLPVIAFLAVVAFLFMVLPEARVMHYFVFLGLFLAVSFSRMLEFWQFGIECYNIIIFCFVYVLGASSGILFVLATSVMCFYSVFFLHKHYFVHTVNGPAIQTFLLLFFVALISIAKAVAPGYMAAHLIGVGIGLTSVIVILDHLLSMRLAGIDWGRASVATVVGILINYNLFLLLSERLIALIS